MAKSQTSKAQVDAQAQLETQVMPESYEMALKELESLVLKMESGELSLEASLAAYQRGAALTAFCQKQLARVEHEVRVLEEEMPKAFQLMGLNGEES